MKKENKWIYKKLPEKDGIYWVKPNPKYEWVNREVTWAVYDSRKEKFYLPGGIISIYIEVIGWKNMDNKNDYLK